MTIDAAVKDAPAGVAQNVEGAPQEYGTAPAVTPSGPLRLLRKAGGYAEVALFMVGLTVALAVAAWTSAAMAETDQACTELPSTAEYNDLGNVMEDRFDGIPGQETVLHGYLKGTELVVIASFVERDHPYAFWREDTQTGQTFDTYIDSDNDCVFETYVEQGESDQSYDLQSWGFQ